MQKHGTDGLFDWLNGFTQHLNNVVIVTVHTVIAFVEVCEAIYVCYR